MSGDNDNNKLSVIIPARNEQFLQKTIACVLAAAEEEIEVIAVCDGYWPDPVIPDHPSVVLLHYTEPVGQRQGINRAARVATGKYIMKLDAHCNVAKGFDKVLKEDCLYEWTMVPRMYNLDITTFEPKKRKFTDYMYISSPDHEKPFRAMYYGNYQGAKSRPPKSDKLIDETMCCMGPGWFMHKDRFWEQGGCDEGHGGWGQQGVEVSCKAWLSGGALMVNKRTWFAHWFRGGGVPEGFTKGFPYEISGKAVARARKHSKNLWLNNNWEKQTRTFQWLVEKFQPPTWDVKTETVPDNVKKSYYKHMISGGTMPKWFGTDVIKYPGDMIRYAEIIQEKQPDVIVETGTYRGGSALFFAHMMDLVGKGEVITLDIKNNNPPKHPRITHMIARATDHTAMAEIRKRVEGKTVMVVLDSNHHRSHVKRELGRYKDIVTPGQYIVVEDTNFSEIGKKNGPNEAVDWFVRNTKSFKREDLGSKYMFTLNPNGWLLRIK